MAMSHPVAATHEGTCIRCKGGITIGDPVLFFNRPYPRSRAHAACVANGKAPAQTPVQSSASEPVQSSEPAMVELTEPAQSSEPVTPVNPIDEAIRRLIDEKLNGFEPDSAVDEATVRRMIAEATGTKVTVEIKRPDGSFSDKVENAHNLLPRAAALVGAGLNVVFWGPKGTGKTTMAMQIAKLLGVDFEFETLSPDTSKISLLGYKTPNGEFVGTPFLRAYTEGKLALFDELDLGSGSVQGLLNGALANGFAPSAQGKLPRSDKFYFVGTTNTPGLGPTPEHKDRKPMGDAFRDRLYFVYVPLDRNIMRRKVGLPTLPVPERERRTCTPQEWVLWCEKVDDYCKSGAAPTISAGQRAAEAGLVALAIGESPAEVADGLVFRGCDQPLKDKILRACPLP